MHADYRDIMAIATAALRAEHTYDDDPRSTRPECPHHHNVEDTGCICIAEPLWWDENGTPRFAPHAPDLCPDIYADEVALLEIACQSCGERFAVQMSSSVMERLLELHARGGDPDKHRITLADQISTGKIHYGDPPNTDCCPAGATMNCIDHRVLEFWRRGGPAKTEWIRVRELEIALTFGGV